MRQPLNKLVCLFILIASHFGISAQQDLMLYNMSAVPQSQYTNPASAPETRVNIGLPMISSVYFRHENTFLNPFHLFEDQGGSLVFRTQHYLDKLKKRNTLGTDVATDLFSFGFKVKEKQYFSFAVRNRIQSRVTLPHDMLAFPFTGNASFNELDNGNLDFTDFRIQLNHFREYGIGWQMDFNEKWNFGGRLKLLYGMENIDTKASTIQWNTNPDTWDWTFSGEMDVYSSGIWSVIDTIDNNSDLENGGIGDYLFKRNNWGMGVDLGTEYQINEKLSLSASVTDLGFIKWKNDNRHVLTNSGEFVYTGLAITENLFASGASVNDTINAVVEDMQQGMIDAFALREDSSYYSSSIMARMHLGANYQLYEMPNTSGSAGLLLQSEFYKGHLRPTVTLSYQQNVGKWLSASLAYSIIDGNYRNLGFGMTLNGGPIQFYVSTDNLLASVLTKVEIDDNDPATTNDKFTYPSYAKTMQFHAGLNLTFGMKPSDRDGDGILDKKDACPDTPGIKEFDGCPDTDQDGIPDKEDACPEIPGIKEFHGCPDSDQDGIQDSEDLCPNIPGIQEFSGCPDTDGDGIQDSNDDCPKDAGLPEFRGCPDRDKDGIKDSDDRCPDTPGEIANQGCPWPDTDEDGLLDKDDDCPTIAGPKENGGCPYTDTDGDGVLDKDDDCVFTPGPVENQGCPIIKVEEQEVLNTAFENLEFESGNTTIKDESFASLIELAELLAKKSEWKLQISGHTDDVGNDASNMKLSEGRSQAVADFIGSQGVSSDRLIVKWYGESVPIADNRTKEGRQINRRVEMEVVFD